MVGLVRLAKAFQELNNYFRSWYFSNPYSRSNPCRLTEKKDATLIKNIKKFPFLGGVIGVANRKLDKARLGYKPCRKIIYFIDIARNNKAS
jgi:hypothetical protein